MTAVNIIIFGLLAVYLDQVIPNEFGKKRHPLFCIRRAQKNSLMTEEEDPD
jgi:ATP-binding cassette subfamily A (ABC1) protein 3